MRLGSKVLGTGTPVYLLGDVNIDLLRPEKPDTVQYSALLTELSLKQLVQQPTHPGDRPSLIDHALTNQDDSRATASVIAAHVSDHDLTVVTMPFPRVRRKPRELTTRSMRHTDFDRLCLDLLTSDWSDMLNAEDVNTAYDAFLRTLNAAVDNHCPLKRVRFRHRECPWLTLSEDLLELQQQRDTARREWDAQRTADARKRYISLRRRFRAGLARARSEFFAARRPAKDMWKDLRSYAISSTKTSTSDINLDAASADQFNKYFAGVGRRIAEELAALPGDPAPPRPPAVVSAGFRVRPITLPELGLALRPMRQRIDKVISFAARVVSGKRKHDHISETRRQLGWLSFEQA
ncbi:hypothetical protein FJT64_011126 [Amphibalanus amphitrite]|uniref:Endonuclease/exonuclease/phosphatase domain-containing protein n=1 Tax=Amphibalanus amphitrite TaxID=1232801 RepID=A0A6A4VJZ8_AMPAM|nr:hypothetical protein FJT64_011126 [Amphibalanus amphitrite]